MCWRQKGMEQKRFSKNDSGFICAHCGKEVEPLGFTSRNHCPFCLWSLHVDVHPGDRANQCKGQMEPIRVEPDAKKGYVITGDKRGIYRFLTKLFLAPNSQTTWAVTNFPPP